MQFMYMALLKSFLSNKKTTANIAKERLQIIVAERRPHNNEPHYLPQLKKDILTVIQKYIKINPEIISVQLDSKIDNFSVLELNIILQKKNNNF